MFCVVTIRNFVVVNMQCCDLASSRETFLRTVRDVFPFFSCEDTVCLAETLLNGQYCDMEAGNIVQLLPLDREFVRAVSSEAVAPVREALAAMVENSCAAAEEDETGSLVIRCTPKEWNDHVAATSEAALQLQLFSP